MKPKWNKWCCVNSCNNSYRTRDNGIVFYSFPKASYKLLQREQWISWVRLVNNSMDWEPSNNSRICNEHFIGNKRSTIVDAPNYVPVLLNKNTDFQPQGKSSVERCSRRRNKREMKQYVLRVEEDADESLFVPGSREMDQNIADIDPLELETRKNWSDMKDESFSSASGIRYQQCYNKFIVWCDDNDHEIYTEDVILKYFQHLSITHKRTSLRVTYSRLKMTLKKFNNLDISNFRSVSLFLKKLAFEEKKAKFAIKNQNRLVIDSVKSISKKQENSDVEINSIIFNDWPQSTQCNTQEEEEDPLKITNEISGEEERENTDVTEKNVEEDRLEVWRKDFAHAYTAIDDISTSTNSNDSIPVLSKKRSNIKVKILHSDMKKERIVRENKKDSLLLKKKPSSLIQTNSSNSNYTKIEKISSLKPIRSRIYYQSLKQKLQKKLQSAKLSSNATYTGTEKTMSLSDFAIELKSKKRLEEDRNILSKFPQVKRLSKKKTLKRGIDSATIENQAGKVSIEKHQKKQKTNCEIIEDNKKTYNNHVDSDTQQTKTSNSAEVDMQLNLDNVQFKDINDTESSFDVYFEEDNDGIYNSEQEKSDVVDVYGYYGQDIARRLRMLRGEEFLELRNEVRQKIIDVLYEAYLKREELKNETVTKLLLNCSSDMSISEIVMFIKEEHSYALSR